MSNLEFKRVVNVRGGKYDLVELSGGQKARIPTYIESLLVAERSNVANPPFSNYFCKESIGLFGDSIAPAGNIEYGCCQALHGEESADAALRALVGRRGSAVVLGIAANQAGRPANPCGNCRDIMLEDLDHLSEVVHGNSREGTVVVATLKDYLFDAFSSSRGVGLDITPREVLESCRRFGNDAYSGNVPPERRYCVMIQTRGGRFFGAHDIMCDYHPIYAGRDAVRQARRVREAEIVSVVVVYQGVGDNSHLSPPRPMRPPHVMYKDRQHIMELNYEGEIVSGKRNNPPVFLAALNDEMMLAGFWETTLDEWLPLPFTPRNFMDADAMAKYYKGLRGL